MAIFTPHEREILKGFKKGAYITEEAEEIVDDWASIGFVSCGYDLDEMRPTARLNEIGIRHLNR